ncbi:MAG: iron ABC transporter permease [Candidatus Freyarchaeota archaeon]|nr:iron ABC transporter permease [Candidatus Jordarchaeia archaeon]
MSVVRRKVFLLVVLSLIAFIVLSVLSLSSLVFGAKEASVWEVLASLNRLLFFGGPISNSLLPPGIDLSLDSILYYSRIPRTIAAILVGSGLAVSGTIMQALVRNPLVDPYISGVSSGAALGAVLFLLTSWFTGAAQYVSLSVAAFAGGLAAFTLTFLIYRASGETSLSFVLGGVIVGVAFSSMTTLVIVTSEKELHGVLFWIYGSVAYVRWDEVWVLAPVVVSLILVCLLFARLFNVFMLGDEQAAQMGVNVKLFRRGMMATAALLASVCVAFTGIIGFVGLVVPHMIRLALGSDHRLLLPLSSVFGANLLLAADILARVAMKPMELPIGVITSFVGIPFFVYLLVRRGKKYGM